MSIGAGNKVFRVDKQGQWMGAEKFANAPYRVSIEGNMIARSAALTDSALVLYDAGIPSVVISPTLTRVALPGYNALLDTDPDHFALITDIDNVLIKEFTRGSFATAGYNEVVHSLGYVPFSMAFAYDNFSLKQGWKLIGAQDSGFVANNYWAETSTSKLYFQNNTGLSTNFAYYIFYDDQVPGSNPSFVRTGKGMYLARPTKNALTTTNPNDLIYATDLNTFKILKQGTATINWTANGEYTINHGLPLSNPSAFFLYLKFPDGYTTPIVGANRSPSRDLAFEASDAIITNSQIKVTINRLIGAGAATITASYFIFESPLTGASGITINPALSKIRVAKLGYNALSDTDPNNYRFLSAYNTLKYFYSGSQNITIIGNGSPQISEFQITHNLGYVPFFVPYVDNYEYAPNAGFSIMPFQSSGFFGDTWIRAYADANKIYLRMYNSTTDIKTARTHFKIYLNKTGL